MAGIEAAFPPTVSEGAMIEDDESDSELRRVPSDSTVISTVIQEFSRQFPGMQNDLLKEKNVRQIRSPNLFPSASSSRKKLMNLPSSSGALHSH